MFETQWSRIEDTAQLPTSTIENTKFIGGLGGGEARRLRGGAVGEALHLLTVVRV